MSFKIVLFYNYVEVYAAQGKKVSRFQVDFVLITRPSKAKLNVASNDLCFLRVKRD